MTASVRLTVADGMSELDPLATAVVTETTDRTSIHVAAARPADVDVRAEFRVWGSYPKAMCALTGKAPERHAAPSGRVLAIGGLRGPDAVAAEAREDGSAWLQSREVGRFGPKNVERWVF